jgi:2,4-diketo-3-deoxy-L-fuconate hydrolase
LTNKAEEGGDAQAAARRLLSITQDGTPMRLARFGDAGVEKPGLVDSAGDVRDLSAEIPDIDPSALGPAQLDRLRRIDPTHLPPAPPGSRLGPCVARIPNFIAIGLNYRDHAAETNSPIPAEPVVFNKHSASVSGPNDPIICPAGSRKLDWEIELGVIVGSRCWQVTEHEAMDFVAGYCLVNDVSERMFQSEMGGQWTKGKSSPTFGPLGPYLVTRDEVADPQNIDLTLDVNGVRRQTGHTGNMIFDVRFIVAYLSRFMALLPGDVIITGTPAGVGLGQKPPTFLQTSDVVTLDGGILGRQRQEVVAFDADIGARWRGSAR